MPFLIFLCEHCGEEVNLFLRASQVGEPVICPNCQKEIKSKGVEETDSTPPPPGKGPT